MVRRVGQECRIRNPPRCCDNDGDDSEGSRGSGRGKLDQPLSDGQNGTWRRISRCDELIRGIFGGGVGEDALLLLERERRSMGLKFKSRATDCKGDGPLGRGPSLDPSHLLVYTMTDMSFICLG